jgi:hypothetical protein
MPDARLEKKSIDVMLRVFLHGLNILVQSYRPLHSGRLQSFPLCLRPSSGGLGEPYNGAGRLGRFFCCR